MLEIKFEKEKVTKNTVRYQETSATNDGKGLFGVAVGTLYVQKAALAQLIGNPSAVEADLPTELVVTAEVA